MRVSKCENIFEKLPKRFRKWLRLSLIIAGSVVVLLFLGWLLLTAYVNTHKEQLLKNITDRISADISGKLEIKDMEPTLWKTFPGISVRLDSVDLVDSLFPTHHIKTLSFQSVYVRLSMPSLFSLKPKIKKIILSNGVAHLFTLADGYSNSYLFGRKEGKKPTSPEGSSIRLFEADNITLIINHVPHHKLFKIRFNHLHVNIKNKRHQLVFHARMNAFVHQLGFDLRKGSYLNKKVVQANLYATFDYDKKRLQINRQHLKINQASIGISALFDFGHQPSFFQLDLDAGTIDYGLGVALMPQNIAQKLKSFSVAHPIGLHVSINGKLQYPDTPKVLVRARVRNNRLTTPYGIFEQVSFKASFNNQLKTGRGKGDDNSGIFISKLKGNWTGMPLVADSVALVDLIHPLLFFKIKGDFPTLKLNKLLGSSFAITKGTTSFQLVFQGPVSEADTGSRSLNGYIVLKNADLTYLPRALKFSNCNVALVFQNQDLFVKTMSLDLGKSTILVRGKGVDFLNAYFSGEDKAIFDCQLESPELNLNDFRSLLASRRQYSDLAKKSREEKITSLNKKLDLLLDKSSMVLHTNIHQVDFNKFRAKNFTADLSLDKEGIAFEKVHLQHAGGEVTFDAKIFQYPAKNGFLLHAHLSNLKIDELFYSFSDFGQSTLKSGNLKGRLSATLDVTGNLSEDARLVPKSLKGQVHFRLVNGELNNFPPFLSISKFAFKNRNMEHVTFQTLSNDLTIGDGKIKIPSMDIASSAISITVQGVYAFGEGTDISLKIPLRNPQKDKDRRAMGLKPKKNRGVIVYLRAKDGADGKVHIGWDPNQKKRLTNSSEGEE